MILHKSLGIGSLWYILQNNGYMNHKFTNDGDPQIRTINLPNAPNNTERRLTWSGVYTPSPDFCIADYLLV
jgi:hypothetical protein